MVSSRWYLLFLRFHENNTRKKLIIDPDFRKSFFYNAIALLHYNFNYWIFYSPNFEFFWIEVQKKILFNILLIKFSVCCPDNEIPSHHWPYITPYARFSSGKHRTNKITPENNQPYIYTGWKCIPVGAICGVLLETPHLYCLLPTTSPFSFCLNSLHFVLLVSNSSETCRKDICFVWKYYFS